MDFLDGHTVGIDLGTTYSTLAQLDEEGNPVAIPNEDDEIETASLIVLAESGHVIVGPNRMRAAMLSSEAPPDPKGEDELNPINAIYKSQAVRSAVLARAEAGDHAGAAKTLEMIPAGRHRDAVARALIEVLVDNGAVGQARTLAEAVATDDHRDRAYLGIVAGCVRAGELDAAQALFGRIRGRDCRVVAQTHLAPAAGGSGAPADADTQPVPDAAEKE